jgi:hypothetical protein
MPAARKITCVQRSVMRNAEIAGYMSKGNCLTVNILYICLAAWILKHICVGKNAVRPYLVNIHAPIFALINVEIVK